MTQRCIDLRPELARLGMALKAQGKRGTCSVYAVTAALEHALGRRLGAAPRLSEEYLNWAANEAMDEYVDGGFFSDLWRGFEAHGICDTALAPYLDAFDAAWRPSPEAVEQAASRRNQGLAWTWIKEWDVETGLAGAQFDGILAALEGGVSVCSGMRWPKAAAWSDTGPDGLPLLSMCPPEEVFDGHSVLFVGFAEGAQWDGGGCVLLRNSHNPGLYQAMPFTYVRAYTNDASTVAF